MSHHHLGKKLTSCPPKSSPTQVADWRRKATERADRLKQAETEAEAARKEAERVRRSACLALHLQRSC